MKTRKNKSESMPFKLQPGNIERRRMEKEAWEERIYSDYVKAMARPGASSLDTIEWLKAKHGFNASSTFYAIKRRVESRHGGPRLAEKSAGPVKPEIDGADYEFDNYVLADDEATIDFQAPEEPTS